MAKTVVLVGGPFHGRVLEIHERNTRVAIPEYSHLDPIEYRRQDTVIPGPGCRAYVYRQRHPPDPTDPVVKAVFEYRGTDLRG